jgi:hypothetical protein
MNVLLIVRDWKEQFQGRLQQHNEQTKCCPNSSGRPPVVSCGQTLSALYGLWYYWLQGTEQCDVKIDANGITTIQISTTTAQRFLGWIIWTDRREDAVSPTCVHLKQRVQERSMMYGYRQQDMETYGKRVIHRRTLHACFEHDQCGSHRKTLCLIWVNIITVP